MDKALRRFALSMLLLNGLSACFGGSALIADSNGRAAGTGWIIVQIAMIQTLHLMHLVFGLTGIALIITGLVLLQEDKRLAIWPLFE